MSITSIQKVIKVGKSLAVTIPAKQAKAMNIVSGSTIKMTAELVDTSLSSEDAYRSFKKQYGQTLKNLAKR